MESIEQMIKRLCQKGVEYVKLGEVCKLERGKVFSKKYIEEHPGQYPVFSSQTANNGELGKIDTFNYNGEFLTWTTDGAYAGTIFYREGKFSITNVCGLIKNNDIARKIFESNLTPTQQEQALSDFANKLHTKIDEQNKIIENQAIPFGETFGSDFEIDFDLSDYQ